MRESLESNAQRVKDFTAREQNGLIARNDLLKVQLQKSQVQLSLDEAEKNVRIINYELVQLLKLPAATQIIVDPSNVDPNLFATPILPENDALTKRHDLEALSFAEKAADAHVKVAKSAFFPSLALTGGYVALDLQNVATVTNAMNVGVGVSYNLSSIFKSGNDVKAAKSRAEEVREQKEILSDRIKTGIVKAQEDYNLSIQQDEVYNEAVAQAAENYRIVRDKYDNGLSDTTELLDADVAELSAKINLAYARANRVLKFYELLEATGSLTESFNIKP
ncbi:TolC family protein [Flavobacterium sp. N1718]|uniref:TolC family protein n=1 Tax=Flavobacterium sp. N1718 TaxID=2986822 RepID=UPI0029CAACBF|nr:TolC family protein [Flavobacterium sp. N1718]